MASQHARHTLDCDVIPRWTACYLREAPGEVAFIEAHTAHALPRLLKALDDRGRRAEEVRYIVVTHAHLDHAAGAGALLQRCPNATLLGHPRAIANLVEPTKLVASATRVYGAERFAELYGEVVPVPPARARALDDKATFELGGASFRVHHTAGHARHHFVVEDPELSTVYTGDAFGLTYPALQRAGRFSIASTSPIDFDAPEARRSLDLIVGLGMKAACPTHFDAVTDLAEVAAQVRGWIDRSEAWMESAAASGAPMEAMTAQIAGWIREAFQADSSARGLQLTTHDWTLLATDIDLNAQGIAFAASRRQRA
jgi:glyoxylase-like metal-dependent hydrolase (beta-lactamase superfamily II)